MSLSIVLLGDVPEIPAHLVSPDVSTDQDPRGDRKDGRKDG